MASIKTTMIAAIRAAVETVPNIGTFRGFNGQFDDNRDHPLKFPCVLWELSFIDWRHMKNPSGVGSIQRSEEAEIIFHVGVRSLGVDPYIDDTVFDIVDAVAAAISTVSGDEFGAFQRVNETQDTQHEQVVDHQITFRFKILDCVTFAEDSTTGIIKTLQEHGSIQTPEPDATVNFGEEPQYGTDDPDD